MKFEGKIGKASSFSLTKVSLIVKFGRVRGMILWSQRNITIIQRETEALRKTSGDPGKRPEAPGKIPGPHAPFLRINKCGDSAA